MAVKREARGRLAGVADHMGDDRVLQEVAHEAILQSIYA